MEFFDSHSHYNDEKFDEDREDVIAKTYKEGITKWICAGYNIASSKKAIDIAKKHDPIYAICGISPNDVPESIIELEKLLENHKQKKIVAIGEIGLDYYWNTENKDLQKEIFKAQIEIANKLALPIVIHTREAVIDTLEILKQNEVKKRGIFHCCPMNRELIKEALKLGYYISFAGPVTFKNVKNAEEIVNMVPQDRLLIETDSPYLAPEPKRGIRNTSINVQYIASKIAEFRGTSREEMAKVTYENAKRIFEIK